MAAICFLLCFVAPIGVTLTVVQLQKKQVKREVKHRIIDGIDKDELVLLEFSLEEIDEKLRWKHSKEFEYNGYMYDIVERETRNDTTYFWCWWDHEETELNKQLEELLAHAMGKHPQNKQSKEELIDFYKSLYFQHNSEVTSDARQLKMHLNAYSNLYKSFSIQPKSRPPWLI